MERAPAVLRWRGEAEQELLLEQLRAKFGQSLPPDLEAALPTLTPDERLVWARALVTTTTLEAFRTLVGRPA